jgi:tetratricopeptide (TPR) repeat protein
MGQYPFEWHVEDICAEEFNHFQKQFSRTILQLIPFANGPVTFLDLAIDTGEGLHELNKPRKWLQYIKRVLRLQRSVLVPKKPVLFLPLWGAESIKGIAAVEGIDEQFGDVLSEEWLSDRSRIISREFFLQKQLAVDPVTGMFNGRHLQDILHGLLVKVQENDSHTGSGGALQQVSLLMMEIHPRANNAEKALNYIIRAGYYLESFLGQDVLHHLGNGIFGLIRENVDEEEAQKLGKTILGWFRREGFHRIHVGINTIGPEGNATINEAENGSACHVVIEQTWQALRKASRRGPYSICTYSSISTPETHPLKKTKPAVLTRLRKLWVDTDRFALLLISRDRELHGELFPKRLLALIEPRAEAVPLSESETFVFLKDADEKQALSWACDLKKKLPGDLGTTYSIGIAWFPCIDFKKSDIPQNGRKALLHGGFFGPDSTILFDGISQNVSGDIYYGEGDLVRAIKEYRKGLEMDPANTNLLNSLGEAYAQMNKPRKAVPFFEAVLRTDPKHYMALYNLGVTSLVNVEDEKAIAYFERALAVFRGEPETNQINDLLLQLGKLYCRTGRYKKAVVLLEKENIMGEESSIMPGRYALLRYLGEAYMGSARNKESVMVLQRAIRHNPHDAHALSMLGELYALENQGDDIALSLCLQAVNIDDRQWKHWYRLALVRQKMGDYESALEALKKSMRLERMKEESLYLAGKVYDKLGIQSKAAAMFETVLEVAPGHKNARAALKKIKNLK